jgi:predicted phage tail protein
MKILLISLGSAAILSVIVYMIARKQSIKSGETKENEKFTLAEFFEVFKRNDDNSETTGDPVVEV